MEFLFDGFVGFTEVQSTAILIENIKPITNQGAAHRNFKNVV